MLVLEAREQLGGAATLDRPFADDRYLVSPCAYVVGLLHPLVVEELGLRRHGFDLVLLDPGLWCPFPDGTSIAVYADAVEAVEEPELREAILEFEMYGMAKPKTPGSRK